ncbi:MAG: NTP transferase domain-containing protein [Oscillospiraceae bacterium]|jgi:NDP-sugar pyrophosphorylase family protein/phosphomannomutase|nr:NTP transferase domain-containing protein [Oscillospiraceae bacterium]
MKAIILAGGEGTRLRPLTENMPKPMLDIAGSPVIEHIVTLLAKHGFDDIMLALRYMPEAIVNHFCVAKTGSDYTTACGVVRLRYIVEQSPRGTAGAVADCMDFADGEDVLVVSGDCLCDFDLNQLMRYHLDRRAYATIALTTCACPTEYGLVLTDGDGAVTGFVEKPSWENVVTDRINAGIYALSPRAFDGVPQSGMYDFALDLFPKMLADGAPLYALPLDGYWRDIGTPETYNLANADACAGKIHLRAATENAPRVVLPPEKCEIEFAKPATVSGILGARLPYEAILRLGQAAAQYKTVGLSCVGADSARVTRDLLACGVNAGGGDALIVDAPTHTVAGFAARLYDAPLFACVTQRGESVRITFLNRDGEPITPADERELRTASRNPRSTALAGSLTQITGLRDAYVQWLRQTSGVTTSVSHITVAGGSEPSRILRRVLGVTEPKNPECADVTDGVSGLIFAPSADGDALTAVTESGVTLDFDHMLTIGTFVALRRGARSLTLPLNAPECAIRLIATFGRDFRRSDNRAELWTRDGLLLACDIAAYLAERGVTLDALSREIPEFTTVTHSVALNGNRAAAMRELARAANAEFAAEIGIELRPRGGVARVTPSRGGETLHVRVEAANARDAELVAAETMRRIAAADRG